MVKYKNLKSIAHNLGHSYLSLMNYRADDYIVNHIFRAAREASEPRIRIDMLGGTIEPAASRIPVLLESVDNQRDWFPQLLRSQGAEPEMVSSVTITVVFDFSGTRRDENVPDLELAAYECTVEIIDDRGKMHIAIVPEW